MQEQIGTISGKKEMLEDQKEMLQIKNTAIVMKNLDYYRSNLAKRIHLKSFI